MKQCRISRDPLIDSEMKKTKPIRKLLAANRSEIAIRIFRAANELGLRTVAIYSQEDRLALHRFKADEAYQVGAGKGPVEAYLDIAGIVALAKEKGVDAIHPGYGFLSENPAFARACEKAGIIFVGPPPNLLELLGDKTAARRLAASAGVPVLPGTENPVKSAAEAQKIAREIGYPIIVKAAMGGGGRGMRVVHDAAQMDSLLEEAQGEARSAFGDATPLQFFRFREPIIFLDRERRRPARCLPDLWSGRSLGHGPLRRIGRTRRDHCRFQLFQMRLNLDPGLGVALCRIGRIWFGKKVQ